MPAGFDELVLGDLGLHILLFFRIFVICFWFVFFHVFDRGLVVASRRLEVAFLVHDRTDISQADTLIAVALVEVLEDVHGVSILEHSLRLLLFCHLTVHAGVSDVRHFNNLIESILEIIQLLAGGLVAKLDNATFIDFALGLDLIQCFIELDNALSDLKREPVLTPTTDDDEEEREESQEN